MWGAPSSAGWRHSATTWSEDASALKRLLAGTDDIVLISSDGAASGVMRHHANAVEAAAVTNIRPITFTSIVDTDELSRFYFLPVYRDPERRPAVCSVPSTILRCGLESGGAPE
jgi:NAD(P)H dehydrogenase (quinone)